MDRVAFEQLYEATRRKAVKIAKRFCGSQSLAEDAVQEAAVYFLDRLDTYPYVTPGHFVNIACRRAKNSVDTRPVRGNSVLRHELRTGTALELEDFLYGQLEENY